MKLGIKVTRFAWDIHFKNNSENEFVYNERFLTSLDEFYRFQNVFNLYPNVLLDIIICPKEN